MLLALLVGVANSAIPQAKGPAAKNAAKENGANNATNPAATGELVATLKSAHILLMEADHDYDGHRHRAAVAVGKAMKVLGAAPPEMDTTKGRHERQAASDAQLRQAQTILQAAVAAMGTGSSNAAKSKAHPKAQKAKGHAGALKHVTTAIEEITTALGIR
jgi:hypothetical protein